MTINILTPPFSLCVCAVHGFENTSYSVYEDDALGITFSLDVKGLAPFPGTLISGVITSQPGNARKLLLYDDENLTVLAQ